MRRYLFLTFILITLIIREDAVAEKPTIIPKKDELVIQEGSELKITCYSKLSSVKFSFPNETFMSPRSPYKITNFGNRTSTFLRQNVISLDTGWYACAAKDVEIENHFKILNHSHEDIAWIYVYVKSSEPFADRYYTFPKSVTVLVGSPAIVPCRPTSPDSEVELWQNSKIVERSDEVRFDPKIGFIIDQLVFETLVIHFQCRINGVVDRYNLYYSRAKGNKPKIKSSGKDLTLAEGNELRIECYGKTKRQFSFPNNNTYDNSEHFTRTSEYEIIHDENDTTTFLRRKTVGGDTGWYGCTEEGINMNVRFVHYMEYTRTETDWIYVYVEPLNSRFYLKSFLTYNDFIVEYSDESDVYISYLHSPPRIVGSLQFGRTMSKEKKKSVRFDPKFGLLYKQGLKDSASFYSLKLGTASWYEIINFQKLSKEKVKLFISPLRFLLLTGEDLHLPCIKAHHEDKFPSKWQFPSTVSENRINYTVTEHSEFNVYDYNWIFNILSMKNVTKKDSGNYTCSLPDNYGKSFTVTVIDKKSSDYIKFDLQKDEYKLEHWQNESIKWIVDFKVFMGTDIYWISPSNQSIGREATSELSKKKFHVTDGFRDLVVIQNLTLNDSGVYRMVIKSPVGIITVNFTIIVRVPPIVNIETTTRPYYAMHDEVLLVRCCISGSPMHNITWKLSNYPHSRDNEHSTSMVNTTNYELAFTSGKTACFDLKMTTNISGILTCTACDFINCDRATTEIIFSDTVKRFGIIGPAGESFPGDYITLKCAGSINDFHNLSWDENFNECNDIANQKSFHVSRNDTQFIKQTILYIRNVTKCHDRLYSCSGITINGDIENLTYNLNLSTPKSPYFTNTNLDKLEIGLDPKLVHNKTRTLICCADGYPRPNVTWYKNDVELEESQEHHFLPEKCELLVQLNLHDGINRRYKCRAQNRFGEIEDYTDFKIKNYTDFQKKEKDERELDKSLLLPNIFLVFLLVGLIIAWVVLRKRRIKRARKKFKEDIIEKFNEGAWAHVQPYKRIADQAEILPYDTEWEYPRKFLKLDKTLGSGAFGIVRKAEAKSICRGKAVSTVAVKMVRATHRLHYMTALIRELKVLVHLGGHLNIVNLLGACTKNVSYGELLVIVEFCRFGNLHDYLFRGRKNFIDQLDPETGEIIGQTLGMDRIDVEHNGEDLLDRDENSDAENSCRGTDFISKNTNTNDEALVKGTVQPSLRCHYRGDDPDLIVESICTKDLMCWAWQVTRGMCYLGLRKVVHGDLAARNVLLADNNVIKICDFGLAEILYKDEDYKKLGDDPLPLQWMAIESINDRVFSTQSDIWSFGILLWEFFTLAETPYRGTDPRNLYQKLRTGYRMSRPKYAPENIYRMMTKCWEANPAKRPSFLALETDIALLLDDGIRTYYMDMSPPYAELTNETMKTKEIDFLTMDPSELIAASFSTDHEKVKLCKVPSVESSCSPRPGPSFENFCSISVPTED